MFQRGEFDCTQCHIAAARRGVPGVLIPSVNPSQTGNLVPRSTSPIRRAGPISRQIANDSVSAANRVRSEGA